MHRALPMSLLRWILLSLSCFACLSVGARAQTPFKFDPARDLEGFEDRFFSEFSDLYPLDKYQKLKGKELPPEELAKLRAEWKVERAAADVHVGEVKTDPREVWLHGLRLDLRKDSFFKDVQWIEDASFPPFLVLVQVPLGAEDEYGTQVSKSVGPWLQRLEDHFRTKLAEPLGLKASDRGLVYPVFVLQSEIEYRDFAGKAGVSAWGDGPVTYQPRSRLVVGAATPDSSGTVPIREMRPILRAAMQAVLDAYASPRNTRPLPLWLLKGFSRYMSHRETAPDGSLAPVVDPEDLSQFVRASQLPDRAELLLHPIEDLAQQTDVKDVENLVKARSEMLSIAPPGREDTLYFFDRQSNLWVHYLRDGRNGRNRAAFDQYFVSALNGRGGLPELFYAFEGTDMAELDTDFVRFVFQEHERLLPNEKLEIAEGAENIFVERAIARAPTGSTNSATPIVRSIIPSSSAPFQPEALAVPDVDVEATHGLALIQAREGNLDGALAALQALQAKKPGPPMDVRIARDIERVQESARLRLGYLDYLRQSGGVLSVDQRGLKFEAGVTKVEKGQVFLASNKLGLTKISLDSLTPFQIARQAGSKEKQGGTEPWVRFYPYIIAGETKWEKLLKDDSPKSKELRADAADWYPDLVRVGAATTLLNTLAKTPPPQSNKDVAKVLDSIKKLVSDDHDLRVVQDKMLDLKQIAAVLIMKTYVEKDPGALAHGLYRFLGNGLANILYDFTDAKEAKDFVKHDGYLPFWRKGLTPTAKTEEESEWTVKNGELYGVGAACYRHFLSFTAPITLRYDLRFDLPAKDPKTPPFWMVAVCDDGKASFASCHNFSGMNIVDMKSGYRKELTAAADTITYKHIYQFEIHHDGTNLTFSVDGEKKAEAPVGERQTGAVMLWFSTDYPLAISKLEIEGKIDPKWADRAKTEHLKARMVELGFR